VSDTLRLFTGIALPDRVTGELRGRLPDWQRRLAFGKWTHPDDWHVTLHFLGEMPADRVDDVQKALDRAASVIPPFELQLADLGTFGAPRSPSILWIGLPNPPEPLFALHAELGRTLLDHVGFKAEQRPYRPHLTIARKYRGEAAWSPAMLEQAFMPELSFSVTDICLFVSRLGRSPMYEIVHRSPLT